MFSQEVLCIIGIVFMIALMALIPPFMQFKITDTVNSGAFRLIKIKKLSFMFRAPGGESVREYGVPIPLFAIQVAGYVLAIFSIILNVLLLTLLQDYFKTMAIITSVILGVEVVFIIIFTFILGKISNVK